MAVNELTAGIDGLTKAGAQHLRLENQQLKQQLALAHQIIQLRGGQVVGGFLEGLQGLLMAARQGDPQARENLRLLREAFDEMRLVGLIAVPGQK